MVEGCATMSTSAQFVHEVLGDPGASDRIDIISDRTSLQSYIRYKSERAQGRNVKTGELIAWV